MCDLFFLPTILQQKWAGRYSFPEYVNVLVPFSNWAVNSPREGGQAGFNCRRNPGKCDSSAEETRDGLNNSYKILKNIASKWNLEILD